MSPRKAVQCSRDKIRHHTSDVFMTLQKCVLSMTAWWESRVQKMGRACRIAMALSRIIITSAVVLAALDHSGIVLSSWSVQTDFLGHRSGDRTGWAAWAIRRNVADICCIHM